MYAFQSLFPFYFRSRQLKLANAHALLDYIIIKLLWRIGAFDKLYGSIASSCLK